eukprot:TRINITY_DN2811_c0_g1_i1.p1 TRINITY_DN2811_c0_g1~~TRINITY_DN2811_c0_g1_i1.p1  ORF type:complete len:462 (+),score=149.10 TRINITY_DN2811_c0_g1_i1:133-1518(+)
MNKYEVLGTIGEGSYGVVLRCRHKQSRELVAIKKFKQSDDNDETVRKTTKREVKILRMLKHDNIVALREAFRARGKLYLVFEYVDSTVLERLEQDGAGPSAELVRRWLYQLTSALFFCHAANVVHRDIKPENLLVTAGDTLKLCDFGFARNVATRSAITRYVATRWYRAPELLVGASAYGKPVDVWALGCMLAEMYTRKPLFAGESDLDQLWLIERLLGPLTAEQRALRAMLPGQLHQPAASAHPQQQSPPMLLAASPHGSSVLRRKLRLHVPPLALDMLESMLAVEPSERPTCEQLLEHPFFEPEHRPGAKAELLLRAQHAALLQTDQTTAAAGAIATALAPLLPTQHQQARRATKDANAHVEERQALATRSKPARASPRLSDDNAHGPLLKSHSHSARLAPPADTQQQSSMSVAAVSRPLMTERSESSMTGPLPELFLPRTPKLDSKARPLEKLPSLLD